MDQPTADSLEDQASRLEAIRNVQRQSKLLIEQAQIKAKENFARWNVPRRPRSDSLSPGDYVIMQRPGNIRGFKLHWEGPYHFDGWVGEELNRRAVLRDQKGQVWQRPSVEVLSYLPRETFLDKFVRLFQSEIETEIAKLLCPSLLQVLRYKKEKRFRLSRHRPLKSSSCSTRKSQRSFRNLTPRLSFVRLVPCRNRKSVSQPDQRKESRAYPS